MKYEEQEVFLVWTDGKTGSYPRIYDSRADALRFTGGDGKRIERRKVIPYSGRGPYQKPWMPTKKRGKKK